ncbi:hypothetical protein KQ944_10630 [Bacillus subtilis]|nr:hypothetical protein [Bacillus subtilis]
MAELVVLVERVAQAVSVVPVAWVRMVGMVLSVQPDQPAAMVVPVQAQDKVQLSLPRGILQRKL